MKILGTVLIIHKNFILKITLIKFGKPWIFQSSKVYKILHILQILLVLQVK